MQVVEKNLSGVREIRGFQSCRRVKIKDMIKGACRNPYRTTRTQKPVLLPLFRNRKNVPSLFW
jgi:hypothetical protein